MTNTENILEPLIDKAQAYAKTSCDLLKLQALNKSSTIAATVLSRTLLLGFILSFILSLSVAASLFIGEALGKNYLGFLIVSAFYLVVSFIVYLIHPTIKSYSINYIIRQSQII
jgi:hypothetical protein